MAEGNPTFKTPHQKAAAVQPRKLPSDKLIAEFRENIKSQSWQWLYGMIATYGLRSSIQ
ncbi:MAG: hypothetical protein HWQ35_04475 [Nostoc sp. NMS1]|uniref:hypothetical protein n=1 Tax=unclassified Nostoc TaxID=2593658 RepID=UPI0026015446|nr:MULTISPECIES: hypothetical protein [unclassified Nostoc]MBN3905852.1 hypothetical protein [Nostoc sp. NMS1]MBN3991400.1 hypothetical protein [Nostoc sp. NMS2]